MTFLLSDFPLPVEWHSCLHFCHIPPSALDSYWLFLFSVIAGCRVKSCHDGSIRSGPRCLPVYISFLVDFFFSQLLLSTSIV